MKTYLFVGGLARSGTSALCEMLNGHPRIAVGMERYKALRTDGRLFTEADALFERERFFDWRPEDTNLAVDEGKYADLYAAMRAKYEDAVYVGDKVPAYYENVDRLLAAFPGARIVLIWRALDDVAMSWDRRSRDASSWSRENDADAALARGVDALRKVLTAAEAHGESVRLVRYERVFAAKDNSPMRLIRWLGLEPEEAFLETIRGLRRKSQALSDQRAAVREDVAARARDPEVQEITARLEAITL